LVVPLLFRVYENENIYDIAIQNDYVNSDPKRKLINLPAFEEEAVRLLASSGKWTIYSYKGNYINKEVNFLMPFDYHPNYFKPNNNIILNPTIKQVLTAMLYYIKNT